MRMFLRCAILTILISVQRGMTGLFAEPPPQDAGDVPYDAAWGGTPKAHTNDPTPVSAENNSLGKKGAIGAGAASVAGRSRPLQRSLQLRGGCEAGAAAPDITELMGPQSNIVMAIASKVGRNLHNKMDHPLQIIKTWITQHFSDTFVDASGSPIFACLDTLSPVVSTTTTQWLQASESSWGGVSAVPPSASMASTPAKRGAALGIHGVLTQCTLHGTVPIAMAPPQFHARAHGA